MPGSCVGRLILERRTQPFFRPFSEPPAVRDGGLRGVPRDNMVRVGVTNLHLNSVHAPEYMLAPMSSVRGSIDPSVVWLQSQRARSDPLGLGKRPCVAFSQTYGREPPLPGAAGRDAASLNLADMNANHLAADRRPQDMRRTFYGQSPRPGGGEESPIC